MKTLENTDHTENITNNTDKETDFEIKSHADVLKYLATYGGEVDEEFIIEQILKSDYSEPINIAEANNTDFEIKNHEDLIKYLATHSGEVDEKFVIE